jgi:alpha-L-rhamnosidase
MAQQQMVPTQLLAKTAQQQMVPAQLLAKTAQQQMAPAQLLAKTAQQQMAPALLLAKTAQQRMAPALLLTKIQHATVMSALANFNSVPSDCPTRERRGYLGDSQLASNTLASNFWMAGAYTKFLEDIRDAQWQVNVTKPSTPLTGALSCKAPWYHSGGNGCDPSWQVGFAQIVTVVLEEYADTRIVQQNWLALRWFATYLDCRLTKEGLLPGTIGSFGDWCPGIWPVDPADPVNSGESHAPGALISTFQYVLHCKQMARFARVMGDDAESERYTASANRSTVALHNTFWNSKKQCYKDNSNITRGAHSPMQTQQALALFIGAPQAAAAAATHGQSVLPAAVAALVHTIETVDHHLLSGIVGTKFVPLALARYCRMDLAMKLLTQTAQPSWGWWITQGASTLWENWSSNRTANAGSKNHVRMPRIRVRWRID